MAIGSSAKYGNASVKSTVPSVVTTDAAARLGAHFTSSGRQDPGTCDRAGQPSPQSPANAGRTSGIR
jgi:hypothetical protein